MLLKVLFVCVHKWCTHLRKRVFGQFNLCKRLPSVWHIVICSSTSCHLWKHQRKWVMALVRHRMLTPLRGFNNYFFFRYLFYYLHSCPWKPLYNSIREIPDLWGLDNYYLKWKVQWHSLSLMLQFQHDFNVRYLTKKVKIVKFKVSRGRKKMTWLSSHGLNSTTLAK